jgi:hypothetical protein
VGKKGAAKRWQDDGKSDGKSMTNACQNDGPSPSPSPLPNNSPTESSVAPSAPPTQRTKTGRRLPEDWCPSPEDRHFATDLGLDSDAVAAKFRDYWRSLSGSKAMKTDWSATWRNWCRNERPPAGGHLEKSAEIARNNKTRMREIQCELLDDQDDFVGMTIENAQEINYAE